MAITRLGTYAQIKGSSLKLPCSVATTGAITLSGTQTIDGVAVVAGDRVLVKNQGTGSTNGIYVVAAGAWSRAVDMSLDDDVFQGLSVYINLGTTNSNTTFVLTTANPITLGTTSLTFSLSITNPVTGTGTTNTLPKFTGASAIGNSNITDTGTAIALNSDTAIGTTTLAAATKLTLGGSETAVSAIARGGLINSTLVASANSDILVGLEINPTFTNGAFTGVQNTPLRVNGTIAATGALTLNRNTSSTIIYADTSETTIINPSITARLAFRIGTTDYGRFFPTSGNFTIQNGGTFTDAGFRLDVTGTSRLNGQTTITGSTTAASALARGIIATPTLVAAANSDNLIALDIAPTYTNGAFTGVNNIGLRLINTLNSTGDVDPKLNPLFQLSSSFWNSSLGAVRATANLQVTSYQRNTNPTISKLSFLVGTDNAAATEQMFITSAGLFGTNGGANFSGGTGSYLYDVTLIQTAAATSSIPVSSNRLVIKGNSWNSVQGNKPSMGYLQMINVTNNANPTTDKLSFFVGSADNANLGNMVGNATERLAIRTDGIFSYFNLAGTEFLRLIGSTGNILINTTTDVASAKLVIASTTQGFLPPRMTTTQKNAITSPATGLVVFDTTLGKLCVFATTWQTITSV